MARKLNINFGSVPYTIQSATGRIWAAGAPQVFNTFGGSTILTHGTLHSALGLGFGTKVNNYDTAYTAPLNWDNCSHGQAISVRWNETYPAGNTNAADDMSYRANGFRGVSCPSLRSTGYAAGACNGVGSGSNVINSALVKNFKR